MPPKPKGARLMWRERQNAYVIKDAGGIERSTRTADRREAEIALAEYIARTRRRAGPAQPGEMTVAEVLSIYGEEHAPTVAAPERLGYAMQALLPFWSDLPVSEVKGATCRRYAAMRGRAPATIRRELNVLGAALAYCVREGHLTTAPSVTMPPAPESNQRAMTRDEVAALLRSARRLGYRHICHFILISIYTGTRKVAALNLRLSAPWTGGGWFDLDAGILYRRGEGERATKKRRTPAAVPRQLLAHARRWSRRGDTWAVEWRGARIGDINSSWPKVVERAGLDWTPTPHTLKHTAITWAMQGGASIPDASGFFATSVETIERVYWHLSPFYQRGAVSAIEKGAR
jgi:integrase